MKQHTATSPNACRNFGFNCFGYFTRWAAGKRRPPPASCADSIKTLVQTRLAELLSWEQFFLLRFERLETLHVGRVWNLLEEKCGYTKKKNSNREPGGGGECSLFTRASANLLSFFFQFKKTPSFFCSWIFHQSASWNMTSAWLIRLLSLQRSLRHQTSAR